MSKQARTAVKQIAKLLGALGPSFLRTDGGEAERIIDAQFGRTVGHHRHSHDGPCEDGCYYETTE